MRQCSCLMAAPCCAVPCCAVLCSWLLSQVVKDELGAPWYEIYADLTPEPIAAASLVSAVVGCCCCCCCFLCRWHPFCVSS